MSTSRFLSALRAADWLNAQRMRLYSPALLIGFIGMAAMVITMYVTSTFRAGIPLAGDFLSFYAVSKLALAGHAGDAWHPQVHNDVEYALFQGDHGYLAFFYPPPFLLVLFPLAAMPYYVATVVWLVITTALAVLAMRLFLRNAAPEIQPPVTLLLAFPALWMNMYCGQNGALMLAILAGGFAMMDRRPIVAGLVLGLMVMKPQLALALPFTLAASGRWKTFFATGLSASGLCLVSYLAFGADAWAAFLHNSHYASAVLTNGKLDPALLQSLYGSLRLNGASLPVAFGAQILLSVTVLALAAIAARRGKASASTIGALTAGAGLLATPFVLNYDLTLCALPLGWLCVRGARDGFGRWQKLLAVAVFFLPLVSRAINQSWHLPMAPVLLLVLFLAVRRTVDPAVRYST